MLNHFYFILPCISFSFYLFYSYFIYPLFVFRICGLGLLFLIMLGNNCPDDVLWHTKRKFCLKYIFHLLVDFQKNKYFEKLGTETFNLATAVFNLAFVNFNMAILNFSFAWLNLVLSFFFLGNVVSNMVYLCYVSCSQSD